jgi:hypothetical protein
MKWYEASLHIISYIHPTTHNTTMTPARFEPTIQASERPQIHAIDRATTGIGRRN